MCLLNLHEDERSKPSAWIPVGWLPVHNEKRASSRPGSGFHSPSARKMRLYHQCWIEFLDKWAEKTSNPEMLLWANGESRWTQFFLLDCWGISKKQTNTQWKVVICHRCKAPRNSYLHTQHFNCKSMITTALTLFSPEISYIQATSGESCLNSGDFRRNVLNSDEIAWM